MKKGGSSENSDHFTATDEWGEPSRRGGQPLLSLAKGKEGGRAFVVVGDTYSNEGLDKGRLGHRFSKTAIDYAERAG